MMPNKFMYSSKVAVFLIVGASALATLSEACYLQNCPLGKRVDDFKLKLGKRIAGNRMRECAKCGPDMVGQCIGENICCLSDSGCVMGVDLKATLPCRLEKYRRDPCLPKGQACSITFKGKVQRGVCAAKGLCCAELGKCELNKSCTHYGGA